MDSKKMAWIAWKKLIRPKEQGVLDFRDIQSFNEPFLAKLSWRIITKPETLLARILIGKYCPNEDFLMVSEKVSYPMDGEGS